MTKVTDAWKARQKKMKRVLLEELKAVGYRLPIPLVANMDGSNTGVKIYCDDPNRPVDVVFEIMNAGYANTRVASFRPYWPIVRGIQYNQHGVPMLFCSGEALYTISAIRAFVRKGLTSYIEQCRKATYQHSGD